MGLARADHAVTVAVAATAQALGMQRTTLVGSSVVSMTVYAIVIAAGLALGFDLARGD